MPLYGIRACRVRPYIAVFRLVVGSGLCQGVGSKCAGAQPTALLAELIVPGVLDAAAVATPPVDIPPACGNYSDAPLLGRAWRHCGRWS